MHPYDMEGILNKLTTAKRIQVISALVEGNSVRAARRRRVSQGSRAECLMVRCGDTEGDMVLLQKESASMPN